jgi:hypothetical protein
MLTPKPTLHNPDGRYISGLVELAGHDSTVHTARAIGIGPRMLRHYMANRISSTLGRPIPYPEQFALECLAAQACDDPLFLTAMMDLQRACMYRANLLRLTPHEVPQADRSRKILELRLLSCLYDAAMAVQS